MPADIVQTYCAFAYNNAWANHRLLGACESLTQAEFEAVRSGFFPSLQKTLNHILIIDRFYVDALEGGWLGPKAWENQVPCASIADLRVEQSAVDQRLIRFCEALTAASLGEVMRINRNTRVQTERRARCARESRAFTRDDLRAALKSGVRKVDQWTAGYRLVEVEFPAAPIDPFFNANRPEDLEAAERLAPLAG